MDSPIPLAGPILIDAQLVDAQSVLSELPAKPGVVVLCAPDAEPLVAASGDIRAFVDRRLFAPGAPQGGVSASWCVAGSMVEADLAFFEIARVLMPKTYAHAADRWRAWFIRLDPNDKAPAWKKVDLRESAPIGRDSLRTFIGPFRDKHAAARAGAAIDEAFELCREPARLAKAPEAEACVYKEMGRCPAPCDGSESMAVFRGRVGSVLDAAADRMAGATARLEAVMLERAGAMDFEGAASVRLRIEALGAFSAAPLRRAATLDRFGVLMVLPTGRAGWARVVGHAGGQTAWFADVAVGAPEAVDGAARRAWDWCVSVAAAGVPDGVGAARAGLICTHLFGKADRRWSMMPISEGFDGGGVLRAARRAAKIEEPKASGDAASGSQ